MDIFVARFPVFDARKDVYAYELAFRSGFAQCCQDAASADTTSEIRALIDYDELTGGKKALVHLDRDMLLSGYPLLLPCESMIPCIDGTSHQDPQVVDGTRELKTLGYRIAVANFSPWMLDSGLMDLADLIKVNVTTTSLDDQRALCGICHSRDIEVLATQVETQEQFTLAHKGGFTYFQGTFFAAPDISIRREMASNKLLCLRLMKEINQPEFHHDAIAELIEQDVAMTYKLLRLMNSAWFGLRYEVRSVRHALVLLGPPEVRRWASVVAFRQAGEDKPHELLMLSLTRAKFAELLAKLPGFNLPPAELFLLGMFSVLDALMDRRLEEILGEVAVSKDIKAALLDGGGPYANLYKLMLAYEHAQWVLLADLAAELGLDEQAVPACFRAALNWAENALNAEEPAAVAKTA